MTGTLYRPAPPALDPQRDHVAICQQLVGETFAWDMNRALEFALLKTFCAPRISAILRGTGEFQHRPQKRYDDTGLIMGNILKWGYDSAQGRQAIARMNQIHSHYPIPNEDFLYVLSASLYEPIRWNQRYGWRRFTETETAALFYFWRAVGERMGIQQLPATSAEFEAFNRAYEARHFTYSPDNAAVGDAVVGLMQRWLPLGLGWLVPIFLASLMDAPMRRAMGWRSPLPGLTPLLQQGFRLRRWLIQRGWVPQRQTFFVDRPSRTYPQGYDLAQLGPQTEDSTRPSRCPYHRVMALLKG
jgi:hypothetical protein